MIITEIYNGMGLGNQLANIVTTRCIALDNGYEWGIAHQERFKGHSFMTLDFGKPVIGGHTPVEGQAPSELPEGIERYYREKTTLHANGSDISGYDDYLRKIPDNTMVHGLMQGSDYFIHRRAEIREWLKTEPLDVPENVCVLAFRGGEYVWVKDFFLPSSYWENAMEKMKKVRPDIVFRVVTDDVITAKQFFPDLEITHEIGHDWRSIHNAPYVILSNSSFGFFPAWLSLKLKYCIAPKYWGRFNISDGYWSIDQNYTQGWNYLDRDGVLTKEK